MKKYFSKTLIALCGLFLFAACQKTETKIDYAGGATAPVLTSNVADKDTVALSPSDSLSTALILSWTNPDYVFSNGISSLNVNYTLQIDTVGSNFTNPKIVEISMTSVLGTTLTVGDLNAKLGNFLLLETGIPHNIAVRVESFLNQGSLPLYSNVLTYVVTPYAPPPKITPPSNGQLFIVGSAVPGGWPPLTNDQTVEQFTQVSPTLYKITIPLIAGGEYKFVAIVGQWTEQWSVAKADDPDMVHGGTIVLNGANTLAPTSGTFDIEVNFQLGTFTVTPH